MNLSQSKLSPAVLLALITVLLAPCAVAQDFELQSDPPGFPSPMGAVGDPEGISTNGIGGGLIGYRIGTEWPCSGSRNLIFYANGSEPNPTAGVPPTTLTSSPEVYVPIPVGATAVSFCWNGWSGDAIGNSNWNDGVMIDVVDGSNNQLSVLVYRDAFSDPSTGVMSTPFTGEQARPEFSPAGMKTVTDAALPAGAAFLRVTAFSGNDASFKGAVAVDGIVFAITRVVDQLTPYIEDFESGPGGLGNGRLSLGAGYPLPDLHPFGTLGGQRVDDGSELRLPQQRGRVGRISGLRLQLVSCRPGADAPREVLHRGGLRRSARRDRSERR